MNKAVVTGASRGIGRVVHDWLVDEGWKVVGVSRGGPNAHFDLSRSDKIPGLIVSDLRDEAPIDLLVNNAGVMYLSEVDKPFAYQETLEVNLIAPYIFMVMLPALMPRGSNIINIGSVSGIKGEPDAPMYGATKAGIINLTKSFASLLADKGIRVNCISPGFVNTTLCGEHDPPVDLLDPVLLHRAAEPEELIASVKCILDSSYMTGTNIVVDGGLLS